jgi:drug/metabolite transporter (DMT)-like permease
MKLTHRKAVLLMVAVTLMWSIAGVVTRHLEQAKGFEVTFWRSLFTALSLLVILPLWQGKQVFRQMHWTSRTFWLCGVCWAVMFTAFMTALTLTSVGNVLVTLAAGPLMTALMSRLINGYRLPLRTWLAIAAACGGIAYMFAAQMDMAQPGAIAGCLVALLVPVAASVNWSMVQRAQAHGDQIDLVPCVLVGASLSALLTFPFAMPFAATAHDVAWLSMLGLVQLAIPCALAVVCARVLKAPEVSLLALLEVIFGIALAWWGANEVPSAAVLRGGAVVLGALFANEWWAWRTLR